MGNCITSKITLAEDDQREVKTMKKTEAVEGRTSTFQAVKRYEPMKEKRVRFRIREDDANGQRNLSETKTGAVRISLVLTQKEFNQILNGDNRHSSAEKLLKAINMRSEGISLSRSNDRERDGNWRPSLESIPEDN